MDVHIADALARACSRHLGGPATIERLVRDSGGASRETWSFDAVVNGARHELILRRDPPTMRADGAGSLPRATEFHVLRAAFQDRKSVG